MQSGQRAAFLAAAEKAHKKGKMPPQFLKHMKKPKTGPALKGAPTDAAVMNPPPTNPQFDDNDGDE